MKRIAKAAGIALAALALLLVVALVWYRSASQPQFDGKISLDGPAAAIDIVRDTEGIPHIYAKSTDDAYFALGFVHAQDRLWQLEMNRRIPAGRMAEILGPSGLATDRFLRTLGIRRNAEAILANLAPDTRAALNAYANGINAYLKNRSGPLPPEFLITGAPAPEPWQPVDSISWQTMMAWDLGANWTQELLRMRLAQRLTLSQINEFLPPYPGDAVLKTQDYTSLYRQLSGTTQQLAAVAGIAPQSDIEGAGSNNWVVAGALSETGKPLLANDPHLSLSTPAIWYFAHLSAPNLNVIGATLVGVPSVVAGHNDQIAWGLTNTAPDVQDLYIERINPADVAQYQTPEGWAAFTLRTETIKVKGQPDVVLKVRETRHGPVITGAIPIIDKAALDAKKYAIAFAWTALRPDDLSLQASVRINFAKNWRQFLDATRDFGAPQQNIVFADVDGNIGFVAPARIPIRKPENDLKGLAPAPGWDARYDWNGFVPFDELPQQYNPASQRFITANQKIVASDYPYFLTSEWALPYRANRITGLIDAVTATGAKHSVAGFAAIQKDEVSLAAQELLPLMLKASPRSVRARAVLDILEKWDGSMSVERFEPLIFNAWVRQASRQIFSDELGVELMNDYWEQRNVHLSTVNVLKNIDGQGRWCVDVGITATFKPQTCDEVLATSLEAALMELERRFGSDMFKWRWGDVHKARSEHRPFSKVPLLAKFFDLQVASPGDTYTINVGRYNLRDEQELFVNRQAASLRALYDLSNLENSRFIHSTGQSGNVFSPLYGSFVQRWARVEYVPMKTNRQAAEMGKLGTLTLEKRN